jgi:Hydrazine synthase alpha subunit middle domain
MNDNIRQRDHRHALPKSTALLLPLLALLFPLLALVGCSSGISGHAPGLAGPQSQDPGTFTYPLAYIKRPPPTADIDVRDLITSTAGGDLYIRDQASAGGVEVNLTKSITTGLGDVRDLDVSPDGKKLLFSLRLPLIKGAKEINQPTWKIYQYDAVLKTVTQLTNDATTRGHDVGAHYLPDGRIVFASTRQAATQAILIDEGRPQYPAQTDDRKQDIFLLHVMNADGSNIQQISFNTNHDFAPSVLSNGQIVFSRYESIKGDQISLYRVNPDGSGLELFYGANSHVTGANNAGTNTSVIQFLSPRQRPDGKLLALVRPLQYTQAGLDTQEGGDIVVIDAGNFVEIHQQAVPSAAGTPATGGTGHVSATTLGVTTDPDKPSLGGRFGSVFPLFDGTNRMLVSWAPCLVLASATSSTTSVCTSSNTTGATVTLAPPEYTIWVYDFAAGTLSPILAAESGLMIVEPVLLQARVPAPTAALVTPPTAASTTLAGLGQGILDIRSVYDFDGVDTVKTQTGNAVPSIAALADPKQATADQRPARFIRVEKAVEIPSKDVRKINNSAFGPAGMGMREILAYAPIEPDGSVKIQLPANVPFTIEILDKNARRISAQQHTSWLQLVPGETKTCTGCHDPANPANATFPVSHGRSGLTKSVYAGASAAGAVFPNTVTSLPAANAGDTMAETRVWNTCQTGSAATCSQIPSIDVQYTDVWTDAAVAGRPADTSFSYLYSNLSTPKPSNTHCVTWDALCRSTIHYPDDTMPPYHIQSLWDFPRLVMVGGVAVDHTCVTCHTPIGAAAAIQIPAGQLDLRALASTDDTSVSTSYRQLLFPRNEQTLIMGVPTPTGVVLPPPMAAGSSVSSSLNFLRLFDGTYHDPQVDHTGFLTTAELRLISEWIDIGAQYYNDPFVAPVAN